VWYGLPRIEKMSIVLERRVGMTPSQLQTLPASQPPLEAAPAKTAEMVKTIWEVVGGERK
jgi:hypothetical protein